jgi:hypothetical protein
MLDLIALLRAAEYLQGVADELRDAAASAESEAVAAWAAYDQAVADVESAVSGKDEDDYRFED